MSQQNSSVKASRKANGSTKSKANGSTKGIPEGVETLIPNGETEGQTVADAILALGTAPVVESPVVESPVVESPVVESPVVESPVVESPVVESPVVESPVASWENILTNANLSNRPKTKDFLKHAFGRSDMAFVAYIHADKEIWFSLPDGNDGVRTRAELVKAATGLGLSTSPKAKQQDIGIHRFSWEKDASGYGVDTADMKGVGLAIVL
jgi:hypothetical protein